MTSAVQQDESTEFWLKRSFTEVAQTAASLTKFWREQPIELDRARMLATRIAMGSWLRGEGIEVGAGDRPFPIPNGVKVRYGDIRDAEGLRSYFGDQAIVRNGGFIDAQTFEGIGDNTVDFVISAHVIEHLFDPLGGNFSGASNLEAWRSLLAGGSR